MGETLIDEVRALLVDVGYPASKEALLAAAQRHEAGEDALRALRALPPVDYGNESEVLASIDVHPAESAGQSRSDKARRTREHGERGLAQHMKDVEPSPIEKELGSNQGG